MTHKQVASANCNEIAYTGGSIYFCTANQLATQNESGGVSCTPKSGYYGDFSRASAPIGSVAIDSDSTSSMPWSCFALSSNGIPGWNCAKPKGSATSPCWDLSQNPTVYTTDQGHNFVCDGATPGNRFECVNGI